MYIILSIYSKNINSLIKFLKLFYRLRKFFFLRLIFQIKQSKKKNKFFFISVLKSPHVNKKAQDQFESNLHNKHLKITVSQINKFLFICKWLKRKIFFDLKMKIEFLFQNSLKSSFLVETTDFERFMSRIFFKEFIDLSNKLPKNIYQKFSQKLRKKKLYFTTKQTFLKLVDINGESLLKTYY